MKTQSTTTTKRCRIQEVNATDAQKRWTVVWTANSESAPVRIVCRSKLAARTLAEVLNSPGCLWPC
jgi:hypothetical protein